MTPNRHCLLRRLNNGPIQGASKLANGDCTWHSALLAEGRQCQGHHTWGLMFQPLRALPQTMQRHGIGMGLGNPIGDVCTNTYKECNPDQL